jgi:hypothetical protein
LKHFDFFGGYEERVLECKVNFAALQLGIIVLNEIDEYQKFMWWRQEKLMMDYKYKIHDFLEYKCFFGIYNENQKEYQSPYQLHHSYINGAHPKY